MEVQLTAKELILLLIASGTITGVIGAALAMFGQIWLEKIKHRHKKEERKEDRSERSEEDIVKQISEILKMIDDINKALDDLITATRGLYQDKIQYLSNRYVGEESITFKEQDDLEDLYKIYKACLHGEENGKIKKAVDKANALKHVTSKPDQYKKVEDIMRSIMGGKNSAATSSDDKEGGEN